MFSDSQLDPQGHRDTGANDPTVQQRNPTAAVPDHPSPWPVALPDRQLASTRAPQPDARLVSAIRDPASAIDLPSFDCDLDHLDVTPSRSYP
jgi:hypothetical protein